MSYQLYRNTTLGNTLQESLDELIQCGQITPHLALKVLLQFDKSINNALANRVKTRLTFKEKKRANQIAKEHGKSTLFVPDGLNFLEARQSQEAGHLSTYRFCDNVWTFVLKDVEFREVQELVKADKVKIVACDGKNQNQT